MMHASFGAGIYVLLGIFFVYLLYPRTGKAGKMMAEFESVHRLVPLVIAAIVVVVWPWLVFVTARAWLRRRLSKKRPLKTVLDDPDMARKFHEKDLAQMNEWIRAHPACIRCGKEGGLAQYRASVWVKCSLCGGRTFTLDPSVPESADSPPRHPNAPPLPEPKCWICGGEAEPWMPLQEVDSGPDWTQLERVCYPCAKQGRTQEKRGGGRGKMSP